MRPAGVLPKYDGATRSGLDAYEERVAIYNRDGGRCCTCGKPVAFDAFQLAHGVAATKANRRRWGSDIIDHPLNKHVVCPCARCNDGALISNKLDACLQLVREIKEGQDGNNTD